MATSETSTRLCNKKPAPQATDEPTLLDLYELLQSVSKRLDTIEGDLIRRVVDAEKGMEFAHNQIEQLYSTVSKLQTHLQAVETDHHKQRILDELRSKEYHVLIYVVSITQNSETSEYLEKTVRDVIAN